MLLAAALVSGAVLTGPVTAPKQRLQGMFSKATADAVLACPTERTPLRTEVAMYGNTRREARVSASGVRYPVNEAYVDLISTSGRSASSGGLTPAQLADEVKEVFATRTQTQLFRSPLLGFLYERGWRQNFRNAGFPGIEKEFVEVTEFFSPVAKNGVIVDMSCGSGLMYRRLMRSGAGYGRVIACDYSEVMLRETRRRSIEEGLRKTELELLRCDVAQLPMSNGSVTAMHAGEF